MDGEARKAGCKEASGLLDFRVYVRDLLQGCPVGVVCLRPCTGFASGFGALVFRMKDGSIENPTPFYSALKMVSRLNAAGCACVSAVAQCIVLLASR